MYHDYFLTNRAIQIQKLCQRTDGNRIELPDRATRIGLEKRLSTFLKSIDKINKLPFGDQQDKGLFSKLGLPSFLNRERNESDSSKPLLSKVQREILIEFERNLVKLQLDDDANSARFGQAVFDALLDDHEFFNSLKPLPQYDDDFGYELLFPSWVNLNTVMLQAHPNGEEARFSNDQQRTLFRFLTDWRLAALEDGQLVAMATFIANRFDPPASHQVLQSLLDQCVDNEGDFTSVRIEHLWDLQEGSISAEEIKQTINDYLTIAACLYTSSLHHRYPMTESRSRGISLPRVLAKYLQKPKPDDKEEYRAVLRQTSQVIHDAEEFDNDFETLLNQHESQMISLLNLISCEGHPAVAPLVQGIIAEIAAREVDENEHVKVGVIQPFCENVAPRMNGLSRPTVVFFHSDFVRKAANRRAFIGCAANDSKRGQMASQLLKIAKNTKDFARVLNLISIAAAVDADTNPDNLRNIQSSISVLQLAQMDKTIGKNELGDLENDIRGNLPESITYLATPLQTALAKDERLAKLYLALHEETQRLQHSGTVANFGVTRAAFGHLSRLTDEDENE